ncbi:MAG: deoxyribose-phosphate aldolase [Spirochaetaceae bacterium]|nr:MAG: deoxyribose-phosphate aldolase [Spirochaetaceae bacterium]
MRADSRTELSRYFDHTLLKPEARASQYETLCREALQLRTRTVCVPPDRVALAVDLLQDSTVEVCTVIGFPLGYSSTSAKVAEVDLTRTLGASEFDVVIPVGRLRDGDLPAVYDDIRAVVAAAEGSVVKVILETALLTDAEKIAGSVAAIHGGAAFLKTSTGFSTGGATVEDIRLLRMVAGESRGVKASGGVRELAFVKACIAAGADRIGASATAAILANAAGGPEGNDGY